MWPKGYIFCAPQGVKRHSVPNANILSTHKKVSQLLPSNSGPHHLCDPTFFFWEIQLIIVLGSTGVTFWQDQLFQGCCWNLLCCGPSRQSQNSESAEKFWLFFIWNSDSVGTFWLFLIKNSESSGTFSLFLIRNSSGICCVVIKGGGANILNLNFRSAFWIITWCGSIKYQNLPFSSGWRNRFSSEYTEI